MANATKGPLTMNRLCAQSIVPAVSIPAMALTGVGLLPRQPWAIVLAVRLPPTLPHHASLWPQEFRASHFRDPSSSYKPQDLSELVTFVWLWPLRLILSITAGKACHSRIVHIMLGHKREDTCLLPTFSFDFIRFPRDPALNNPREMP